MLAKASPVPGKCAGMYLQLTFQYLSCLLSYAMTLVFLSPTGLGTLVSITVLGPIWERRLSQHLTPAPSIDSSYSSPSRYAASVKFGVIMSAFPTRLRMLTTISLLIVA